MQVVLALYTEVSSKVSLSEVPPYVLLMQGVGEVLIGGRHVFMGYLGEPRATSEVITSDGWLRSGDLGYISEVSSLLLPHYP